MLSQAISSITVHIDSGRTLTNNLTTVKTLSEWFQPQFSHPTDQTLTRKDIHKGPLTYPITDLEVKDALHRLNDNHANGPDEVAGEPWKDLADVVCAPLAYALLMSMPSN